MNTSLVYIDTSVYLSLLLKEQAAKPILKCIRERTACSSTLLLIETERNLVRCCREGVLSQSDYGWAIDCLRADKETFIFRDLTVDLCLTGGFPPARLPRANDLVHLRTALWFQKNYLLESFLTLDGGQKLAAKDLGLPVEDL